jgi:hypothetical protein
MLVLNATTNNGERTMKRVNLLILALFLVSPVFGQGLTIALTETDSAGKKSSATLQTDRTRARLDLTNGTKLLYNADTKKLLVMFPGTTLYTELTPQFIQVLAATRRGQPQTTPITYRRTGTSKVGQWTCTAYEGVRGAEKVAEICAAEEPAIGLSASDFAIVQQALDSVKGAITPDVIEDIPTYGNVAIHGFSGFPVRRITFTGGKTNSTIELVEFKRGAIPEANFAVPTAPPIPPPQNK